DEARQQVESGAVAVPQALPAPPAPEAAAVEEQEGAVSALVLAGALALLICSCMGAVPLAKLLRRAHRRRPGGSRAVVGAWFETRDRLRDHGVAASPGMTVRDMREPAAGVLP